MGLYTVYEPDSGRILRSGTCPAGTATGQAMEGEVVLSGVAASDALDFVDLSTESVVPRPEMPVTQSGQTLTVPPGTEYEVRGPAFVAGTADATGTLEFEFADPGEYTVTLKLFPYLDAEVVIHAG